MSGTIHGIWTLLLMIIILGIYAWAWNPKRKAAFDEAANLALDDSHKTPDEGAVS